MRKAEFKDRTGRDLQMWEVPLRDYLATKPGTSFAQRKWTQVHAMTVAQAIRLGKDVPARVRQGHTEESLAEAGLCERSVLGDAEASAELRARRERVVSGGSTRP